MFKLFSSQKRRIASLINPSSNILAATSVSNLPAVPFRQGRAFSIKNNSNGFSFGVFNMSNPDDVRKFDKVVEDVIESSETPKKPTQMVEQSNQYVTTEEWLRKYVDDEEFIGSYSDERSMALVAEATYHSALLGLEDHLAKMSYAEIRKFHPLKEMFDAKTDRASLIKKVSSKMKKPAWSHEASYALQQAAWCVYARHNAPEKRQEDADRYEIDNPSSLTNGL